jgi:putative transposase
MTGRPQLPNYRGKQERSVLEIPFAQIHGPLPPLKGRKIPENDFVADPVHLTREMIEVFDGFDVRQAIFDACRSRKLDDFKPQHLRIVPMRKTVRLEVVVRIPNPHPEGSYLARLIAEHGDELAKLKDDKARSAWLLEYFGKMPKEALPRIASVDLGVNNLATIAYTTGHKGVVHTGGRFNANIEESTDLIAARISQITPERVKELQAKKNALREKGEKLDKAEEIELRTLLKALYEDEEYRRLTGKKNRWTMDFLHKISARIVRDCVERNIDVIVIGRNKGWKDEVNMGREQNRRFCMIAHATLIRLIRYKAEALGIAVAETEESYTSKCSFVNGDVLESFAKKKATQDDASIVRPVKTGRRLSKDRNWFFHRNRHDRWRWVHADMNGAFNIIRKIFKSFCYNDGLTLKFTLMRLSPRAGVVPVRL